MLGLTVRRVCPPQKPTLFYYMKSANFTAPSLISIQIFFPKYWELDSDYFNMSVILVNQTIRLTLCTPRFSSLSYFSVVTRANAGVSPSSVRFFSGMLLLTPRNIRGIKLRVRGNNLDSSGTVQFELQPSCVIIQQIYRAKEREEEEVCITHADEA